MRHLAGLLTPILVLLALAAPAPAQPPEPKTLFLDALGEFSLALDGARGDEGPRLESALARMERALADWDTAIAGYERAMRAEVQGADSPDAARMRMALGVVYADRGRARDALEQFTLARILEPADAHAPLLQGLVYGQLLEDPDRAAEAFRRAASLAATDAATAYVLARHLQQMGLDTEASGALDVLLDLLGEGVRAGAPGESGAIPFVRLGLAPEIAGVEPYLPPVRYAPGFASLLGGDLRAAVEQFRSALAADPLVAQPATSATLRARGAAAFREGDLEDASEALAAHIAEAPTDAEAHRLLGMVETAGGRYANAISALEAAVALDPGDERARLALADALVREGRPDAGVAVLETALTDMPRSGRARYALGLLHRQQGRYLETLTALEQAVSHGVLLGRNSIYQTIGALRRSHLDLESAIDAYAARAALTPNDAAAHQDLGEVHVLLGGDPWAEAEFRITLALDPARVDTRTALAQVYLRGGRHQQAADMALQALERDAGDRQARYVYATALLRLGRTEEGEQHLREYQRLLAEDADAQARGLELGRLRREAAVATDAGDHAAAAALLGEALAHAPQSADAHLDVGLALLKAGRAPDAIEHLSTAAALGAERGVHLHLAEAYDAAGRADDGRRARETHAALTREAVREGGAAR